MESIDSIDTVYRSESVDIVEYNPHPDAQFNPINSFFNRDVSGVLNGDIENNQLTHMLLNENKNKNDIYCWYYGSIMILGSFFTSVIIVIILGSLGVIQ